MLKHWIRRIGGARLVALTLFAFLMGGAPAQTAFTPSAEARIGGRSRGGGGFGGGFGSRSGGFGGGGFGSFGSRGSRTGNAGQGAARMQPLPNNGARNGGALGGAGANRGSWLSRNPLLGTIGAAIAGTVIGSMLMNALGGMGGFGSILMMALFAFALFAIFRMIMARKSVAMAGNGIRLPNSAPLGNNAPRQTPYSAPNQNTQSRQEYLDNSARSAPSTYNTPTIDPNSNTQTRDQGLAGIVMGDPSMTKDRLTDTLTNRFFQIQEAWTNADRQTLTNTLTGELMQEFGGNLSDMERRGERNIIKNIVIRRFDISEAWQEGDVEFVTAHISARLLDYTQRGNQIVSGDAQNPTDFTEFWTFVRMRGRGDWILSAINQEA